MDEKHASMFEELLSKIGSVMVAEGIRDIFHAELSREYLKGRQDAFDQIECERLIALHHQEAKVIGLRVEFNQTWVANNKEG